MSFDGLFMHSMQVELSQLLTSGRVTKIQQPYPNEIILTIRANRKTYPLLLSAHPNYARIQITQTPFNNPETPPNFTMTLRKYLDGAFLEAIKQQDNDRILQLDFKTRDELGDSQSLSLIVEIMGRHSNIILINRQENQIIDLIKHISPSQNRFRTLLPNALYQTPPKLSGVDPFNFDVAKLDWLSYFTLSPDLQIKWLQSNIQGFSRQTAGDLQMNLSLNHHAYQNVLADFFKQFEKPTPTLYTIDGKDYFSTYQPSRTIDKVIQFDTLSLLLDRFYFHKAQKDRVLQQGSQLIHFLNNEIKKARHKQQKLQQTLTAAESADQYKIKGEILTTYLNQVKRGATEITLPNYYNDMQPLKIQLSNQLSPSQNAQKYFNKYQKLKNSIQYATTQYHKSEIELNYLEGIVAQIEIAAPKDLMDIQAELMAGGYLKAKKRLKQHKKYKVSQPEVYYAPDGTKIQVGKNNYQNDQLTLKKAKKTDIWLHAKNIPGSHVVIDSASPSPETLNYAANLAAYHSKARLSASVPVDYVPIKKIKKPNGAKPGFVIYEGQKTLYMTPDENLI